LQDFVEQELGARPLAEDSDHDPMFDQWVLDELDGDRW
jgi:hypothetical protein